MDLHRLGLVSSRAHHFLLVARLGSVRQAALALNVAPSSISRTIKQLEDDLGTPLFERTRQRLKLTSAGELLQHRLRQANGAMDRAVAEIGDMQGLRRGTVTVAVIESAARGLVPEVLEDFWQRYPEINVETQVTDSQHAADLVEQREADIALSIDVRVSRRIRSVLAANLKLGVLVTPDNPIARHEGPLRIGDLAGERVILSDTSLTLGGSIERIFAASQVDLPQRASTNSIGLMLDLAKRGLGAVLQTRLGATGEIARGELVFLPLADARLGLRRAAAKALTASFALEIERMSD